MSDTAIQSATDVTDATDATDVTDVTEAAPPATDPTAAAEVQAAHAGQAVEAVQTRQADANPAAGPHTPPAPAEQAPGDATPAAPEGAALGSAIGTDDEHGADERVMHDDIAAQWELWSMIIGRTAESRLKQIPQRISSMTSAMLSTADGLNLCAVGIPRAEVGRLAALNSSLFAVSAAQAAIVSGHASEPGEAVVGLTTARGSLVLVSFVRQPLGHLVLAVNASDVDLGTMVPRVREVAEDIREWLGTA